MKIKKFSNKELVVQLLEQKLKASVERAARLAEYKKIIPEILRATIII